MNVIGWLLVGLIAGAIARLLIPGRDPMGLFATMILGLIGSVVGGLLVSLVADDTQGFSPAGLIGSILGALIALLVYRKMRGPDRTVTR